MAEALDALAEESLRRSRFLRLVALDAAGAVDGVRTRALGEPEVGEGVEIAWRDGERGRSELVILPRARGAGRIVARLEVTYE
jgi:hypothetical protein